MNYILQKIDPLILDFLNLPVFPTAEHKFTLWMILYLILVGIFLFYISGLLKSLLLNKILPRFNGIDPGVRHSFATIISWVFLWLGFLIVLDTAGVDITFATVIAGALGLGASLSLQTIVANFVSGIIIMFERPIKVGDRVEVGKIVGTITDISLRSTSITTNDNITVIVPNAEFVSSKVINWSYKDRTVRFKIPVDIPRSADPKRAEAILLEVAYAHPAVLKQPPPEVLFSCFGDTFLSLTLLVWTHELSDRPELLQSDINYAICARLNKEYIELPVNEGDVTESMFSLTD